MASLAAGSCCLRDWTTAEHVACTHCITFLTSLFDSIPFKIKNHSAIGVKSIAGRNRHRSAHTLFFFNVGKTGKKNKNKNIFPVKRNWGWGEMRVRARAHGTLFQQTFGALTNKNGRRFEWTVSPPKPVDWRLTEAKMTNLPTTERPHSSTGRILARLVAPFVNWQVKSGQK